MTGPTAFERILPVRLYPTGHFGRRLTVFGLTGGVALRLLIGQWMSNTPEMLALAMEPESSGSVPPAHPRKEEACCHHVPCSLDKTQSSTLSPGRVASPH
jgi:hypothetical protein